MRAASRQGNRFAIRLPVDHDRLVQDPTGEQGTRGFVRECGYVPTIANCKMAFFERIHARYETSRAIGSGLFSVLQVGRPFLPVSKPVLFQYSTDPKVR